MNIEFVPYNLAIQLKELEFDESCFGCYFHNNKDVVEYNPDGIPLNHNNRNSRISAPLYQQAFRWFREKYNLHSGIYPYYDEYEFQIKDFRFPNNTPINGGLMSYEEAELACLKKLIEIVKSK
jgi:hypothetical protein